jgi:hypothetical protein
MSLTLTNGFVIFLKNLQKRQDELYANTLDHTSGKTASSVLAPKGT